MKSENISLSKVIHLEKWQSLQDSLAKVLNLAIITVDYKGNPVTSHSLCSDFCNLVRSDSDLAKYCEKCDSRGGLEAVRLNKPYVYLCHFQIVDLAIPIMIDDKYVGAIMAGQVRLEREEENQSLEQILISPKKHLSDDFLQKQKEAYDKLPLLTLEKIQQTSSMLSLLCNYIVEEALDKNLLLELYQKLVNGALPANNSSKENVSDYSGYGYETLHTIRKEMSDTLLNAYLKRANSNSFSDHTALKPAFEYIQKHKGEKIMQEQMAKLCHLSPSYFSRLFTKSTGENFSSYLSRTKIEWAKQLLETSDLSVAQIGEELGFQEPGYFIKQFKRFEGTTPLHYRKFYRQSTS